MPLVGGGPGIERTFPLYRCLACGRGFDEIEAGEGPEPGRVWGLGTEEAVADVIKERLKG